MLIQTLDGSSSEDNPTGIAHHAHHPTEDIQLQELLRTRTLESQSISSDHSEELLGCLPTLLFLQTSTAEDTERLLPTTEQSMHAVNGLIKLTQKPDGSCTD